ncbi:hypothetical protein BGZ73_000387 [Actinomortierella ambigua]|nr:hypothetical protein BGZ73_000387 [Actinomortierella ambigua]
MSSPLVRSSSTMSSVDAEALFARIHKEQSSQLELLKRTKRAMDKSIASREASGDLSSSSLATLSFEILSDLVDELVLEVVAESHREMTLMRSICPICKTRCRNYVHQAGLDIFGQNPQTSNSQTIGAERAGSGSPFTPLSYSDDREASDSDKDLIEKKPSPKSGGGGSGSGSHPGSDTVMDKGSKGSIGPSSSGIGAGIGEIKLGYLDQLPSLPSQPSSQSPSVDKSATGKSGGGGQKKSSSSSKKSSAVSSSTGSSASSATTGTQKKKQGGGGGTGSASSAPKKSSGAAGGKSGSGSSAKAAAKATALDAAAISDPVAVTDA